MPLPLRPAALVVLLSLTAACTSGAQPPASDGSTADRCGASGLQHLIGMTWPQPVPTRPQDLRVYATGSPVTMDYRAERLNVELTPGQARIVAITCG
jgi:hypothetical protein